MFIIIISYVFVPRWGLIVSYLVQIALICFQRGTTGTSILSSSYISSHWFIVFCPLPFDWPAVSRDIFVLSCRGCHSLFGSQPPRTHLFCPPTHPVLYLVPAIASVLVILSIFLLVYLSAYACYYLLLFIIFSFIYLACSITIYIIIIYY